MRGKKDTWQWLIKEGGVYSVKGGMEFQREKELRNRVLDGQTCKRLWNSGAVHKVQLQAWRTLLRKVPTKVELKRRKCLPDGIDLKCYLCKLEEESINHLFFECKKFGNYLEPFASFFASLKETELIADAMATDFKSIPLIDISPLMEKWDDPNMAQDKGVAEVVRQLDRACREAGFFYVEGHGIPNSLINEIRSISRRFFHLPYDEKLEIKLSAATGYRGYQRVGENITKGVPDMHEAIDF
ncbi:hypothetical protein OROHE_002460 [Orobanche hederae]